MTEKQQNNNCEQVVTSQDTNSQLKGINCERPTTALQGRICFLMSNGNCPRLDGEKLYPWGARIGLPRSTFHGLINGVQNMQRAVAERVSLITGANIDWLISGVGEPFPTVGSQQQNQGQSKTSPELPLQPTMDTPQDLVDLEILTKSIRTLEIALHEARRTMSHEKKAALIASLYALYSGSTHDDETMQKTITQLIRSAA